MATLPDFITGTKIILNPERETPQQFERRVKKIYKSPDPWRDTVAEILLTAVQDGRLYEGFLDLDARIGSLCNPDQILIIPEIRDGQRVNCMRVVEAKSHPHSIEGREKQLSSIPHTMKRALETITDDYEYICGKYLGAEPDPEVRKVLESLYYNPKDPFCNTLVFPFSQDAYNFCQENNGVLEATYPPDNRLVIYPDIPPLWSIEMIDREDSAFHYTPDPEI